MPKAVDIHVHPPPQDPGRLRREMLTYFRAPSQVTTPEELAAKFKELDLFANLLASDNETVSGEAPVSNDYVASIVKQFPDVFMAFGSVDPWKGKLAVREVERCRDLGLRGMKFLPMTMRFFPNDRRFYPLWEKCQEVGMPVMIHTGMAGAGAGTPGGSGIHLKYNRPIPYIDDVAADFPELTIIMAHPSWPWQEEQLAVLLHKANVYMDLSGWSPKYFSPSLVQYANTRLQDKMLFGSDYNMIAPERWLHDFEEAPFRDEVRPKILMENAKRLFGLSW